VPLICLLALGCADEDCDNGQDDDGNGDVDCDDVACTDDPICSPKTEGNCGDEVDNDSDGLVDCDDPDCRNSILCETDGGEACDPEDPVCGAPSEVCDDGEDNDGDGDADCADSDCAEAMACGPPDEQCDDGEDNDGDGAIDCADNDCAGDPACDEEREGICDNGEDDDEDGEVDCEDEDCTQDPACAPECGNGAVEDGEECDDGNTEDGDGCSSECRREVEDCVNEQDDDGDGDVDCEDTDCADEPHCHESVCDNGEDEDGDGDVDCDDADCADDPACAEEVEGICDNREDDDLDGDSDCEDPDCAADPACVQGDERCDDGIDNDGDMATDCADDECECEPVIYVPVAPGATNTSRGVPAEAGGWPGVAFDCEEALAEDLGFFSYPIVNATGAPQTVRVHVRFFGDEGLLFLFTEPFDPDNPTRNCLPLVRLGEATFIDVEIPPGGRLVAVVSDLFFDFPVGEHRVEVTTLGPPEMLCTDGEDNDFDGFTDNEDRGCIPKCRQDTCEDAEVGGIGRDPWAVVDALTDCADPACERDQVEAIVPVLLGEGAYCVRVESDFLDVRLSRVESCLDFAGGLVCAEPSGTRIDELEVDGGQRTLLATTVFGPREAVDARMSAREGRCNEIVCDDREDEDRDGHTDCEDSDCNFQGPCVGRLDVPLPGQDTAVLLTARDEQPLNAGACGGPPEGYAGRLVLVANPHPFEVTIDLSAEHLEHNGTVFLIDRPVEGFDPAAVEGCLDADAAGDFRDTSALSGIVLAPGQQLLAYFSTFRPGRRMGLTEVTARTQRVPELCGNGGDDDFDDLVDCADPDCADACNEALNCADEVDNDDNGQTDCEDPVCVQDPVCEPDSELLCGDNRDNDNDGATDCQDTECALEPGCIDTIHELHPVRITGGVSAVPVDAPRWNANPEFCGLAAQQGARFAVNRIENNTGDAVAFALNVSSSIRDHAFWVFGPGGFEDCVVGVQAENFGAEVGRLELGDGGALTVVVSTPSSEVHVSVTTQLRPLGE